MTERYLGSGESSLGEETRLSNVEGWMGSAACRGEDTELFYPEGVDDRSATESQYRHAKKICDTCTEKNECLKDALDRDERYGMWGGESPRKRLEISRYKKQGYTVGSLR